MDTSNTSEEGAARARQPLQASDDGRSGGGESPEFSRIEESGDSSSPQDRAQRDLCTPDQLISPHLTSPPPPPREESPSESSFEADDEYVAQQAGMDMPDAEHETGYTQYEGFGELTLEETMAQPSLFFPLASMDDDMGGDDEEAAAPAAPTSGPARGRLPDRGSFSSSENDERGHRRTRSISLPAINLKPRFSNNRPAFLQQPMDNQENQSHGMRSNESSSSSLAELYDTPDFDRPRTWSDTAIPSFGGIRRFPSLRSNSSGEQLPSSPQDLEHWRSWSSSINSPSPPPSLRDVPVRPGESPSSRANSSSRRLGHHEYQSLERGSTGATAPVPSDQSRSEVTRPVALHLGLPIDDGSPSEAIAASPQDQELPTAQPAAPAALPTSSAAGTFAVSPSKESAFSMAGTARSSQVPDHTLIPLNDTPEHADLLRSALTVESHSENSSPSTRSRRARTLPRYFNKFYGPEVAQRLCDIVNSRTAEVKTALKSTTSCSTEYDTYSFRRCMSSPTLFWGSGANRDSPYSIASKRSSVRLSLSDYV